MSGGGNLPVGPGIWGFIAFFVLALALWFLVRNMNSRLRRMAYRDRDRAEEFAANVDADGLKPSRAVTPGSESDSPAPGSSSSDVRDEPGDDTDAAGEGPRP